MSFSSDLEKFVKKTELNADQIVRGVVLQLGNSVIQMSPVETGRFRGNWQHGTGQTPIGTINSMDLSGAATLAKLNASLSPVKAGNVEYLINNLPYAIPLEHGHSSQAPAGMVKVTVARFNRLLAEQVKSVR